MFSSIFGKRRSSPVEENETPPIPGANDGFVVVNPMPGGSLYPNMGGMGTPTVPYPQRPAPPAPIPRMNSTEHTFHYLQGVPFSLSKELELASNKVTFATEIGDILAFSANRINISKYNYDFSVERSVLKEC